MTFHLEAQTQAELTAKNAIANTLLAEALWHLRPDTIRAARMAEELIDLGEDYGGDWHIVLGDFNVGDSSIKFCLDQIGPESRNPELGREFGALMLSMDEEDREQAMDLVQGTLPKMSVQTLTYAVYEALKEAGAL